MNGLITCANCGKIVAINSDSVRYVDGVVFCSDECVEVGTFVCDHCGELHPKVCAVSVNVYGDVEEWCEECAEEYAFFCDHCEEYFSLDTENSYNVEGEVWCEGCVDDDAYVCNCCEEYHTADNMLYVNGLDEYVCRDCADSSTDYMTCEECGDLWYIDDLYRVRGGDYVCEDCLNNYYSYCEECEEYVPNDEWDCEAEMCEFCSREGRGRSNARRLSYHSSYRPSMRWFGDERMGLGVEVECDAPTEGQSLDLQSTLDDVNEIMGDRVWFEEDCSLRNANGGGFEMISQPHTIEAFHEAPWKETFAKIVEHGWSAHDAGTCGLHVHFSRELFGADTDTQDDNIAKLIQFFELYYDDIVKISRRVTEDDGNVYYAQKCGHKGKTRLKEYAKNKCSGHYSAVNIAPAHTVEIRIMRGTLNYNTFMASIDFLVTLVKNSTVIEWSDATDDFMWLKGIKPETARYIKGKHAFQQAIYTLVRNGEIEL